MKTFKQKTTTNKCINYTFRMSKEESQAIANLCQQTGWKNPD